MRRLILLDTNQISNLASLILNPGVLESFFSKPEDWISSIMFFPFTIQQRPDLPYITGPIVFGTYTPSGNDAVIGTDMFLSTELFNMGEYKVTPHFNNFADFNGYTKLEVFLPYYGKVEVDMNECINKYLKFRLGIDYASGGAVWYICVGDTADTDTNLLISNENNRILSTYQFQLGIQIPIGSTNTAEIYRNILMSGVKAIADVGTAYATSSLGIGKSTSTTTTTTTRTRRNPKTGRQIKAGTSTTESTTTRDGADYNYGVAISSCFETAVDSLNNMHIATSSDKAGNPLLFCNSCQSIKIVQYYPKLANVGEAYNHLYGLPLGETRNLSEISGYTEISNYQLEDEGFGTATQLEVLMLKQALSNGIIL